MIFTDADFIQAVEQNAEAVKIDEGVPEEEQRLLVISDVSRIVDDVPDIGSTEEVSTSEASTSRPSTSMSRASSVLSLIGPLQPAPPKTGKKRGRKPMESSVLTSPETLAAMKEKKANATPKKATPGKSPAKSTPAKTPPKSTPPAKRTKKQKKPSPEEKSPSSASGDDDFCTICLKKMPKRLTSKNSIKCCVCKREVHLKCAEIKHSCYTCKHCDSDLDVEDDE